MRLALLLVLIGGCAAPPDDVLHDMVARLNAKVASLEADVAALKKTCHR